MRQEKRSRDRHIYGGGGGGGAAKNCLASLGPRPSRDSLTKEGLVSNLVVLSQHVNVNCVLRPDNHVVLYQFASSISGRPSAHARAVRHYLFVT